MLLTALYTRIKLLKKEALTLWYAMKHPETPLLVKALALVLVAYFFSPIDLIPDFIPILGMLDELIIIPLGVWLLLKLMPDTVVAQCRLQVEQHMAQKKPKPRSPIGAMVVVAVWLVAVYWVAVSFALPWMQDRQASTPAQASPANPPLSGAGPENLGQNR